MSQRTMEAHYKPNWNLTQAHGLSGYNCGYAASPKCGSFDEHQRALVWQLLHDTPIGPDSTVLDVGCGIGGPSGWIMDRFNPARIISLEYCWSSVRAAHDRAAERDRRPRFVQGDAQSLPLADNSVDVILNLESALHYPDKKSFIQECRRVLKPGGYLCLGDITTRYKRLFALAGLMNRLPTQFNSNVRLWSVDDYELTFAACGLTTLHHENASWKVADSLADGLAEVRARGLRSAGGYRARYFYLAVLEKLLRSGKLQYDLFQVSKPAA